MERCDVLIVGGGAAGLSAATSASKGGCGDILLVDRGDEPGGILRQCIHRGFGPELTGPEYIRRILSALPDSVRFSWQTTVLSIGSDRTAVLSSPVFGLKKIAFRQLILASGCREIAPGSLGISGTRPRGVITAGRLQRDMNLYGIVPEGPAVILGGGDMGLVAAWQLLSAGVDVSMLVEKREKCGGLARNRKRLEGYSLPLNCRATVSRIFGERSLEGVSVRSLETGRETWVPCRTLVIAAGWTPEQALIRELGNPEWLHLCGNCKHIHAVVEGVVQEGILAGCAACDRLKR